MPAKIATNTKNRALHVIRLDSRPDGVFLCVICFIFFSTAGMSIVKRVSSRTSLGLIPCSCVMAIRIASLRLNSSLASFSAYLVSLRAAYFLAFQPALPDVLYHFLFLYVYPPPVYQIHHADVRVHILYIGLISQQSKYMRRICELNMVFS